MSQGLRDGQKITASGLAGNGSCRLQLEFPFGQSAKSIRSAPSIRNATLPKISIKSPNKAIVLIAHGHYLRGRQQHF